MANDHTLRVQLDMEWDSSVVIAAQVLLECLATDLRLIRRGLMTDHHEAYADRDAIIRVLHLLLTPEQAERLLADAIAGVK